MLTKQNNFNFKVASSIDMKASACFYASSYYYYYYYRQMRLGEDDKI